MRDPDITSREKGSIAASGAFFFKERISSGPWGDILYTGPKLSVEEEDVLMALLAIIAIRGGRGRGSVMPVRQEHFP